MLSGSAYYVVQGWMVHDLKLRGNQLALYAIIHKYSDIGNQAYTASINVFCEWLGVSRHTVIDSLKSLEKRGLITKTSKEVKGVIYNSYRAVMPGIAPDQEEPQVQEKAEKDMGIPFGDIIGYLNERAGTSFRASAESSKSHIRARWANGFRLDDFFRVIEVKVKEWKYDKKMSAYLRPSTLFGTKFESYLQQAEREGIVPVFKTPVFKKAEPPEQEIPLDENGNPVVF